MQLLLRVGPPGRLGPHVLDIEPDAPVADLIDAAAAATGEAGPWWLARTRTQLAPSTPVSGLRLRHGDALVSSSGPPGDVPGPGRVEADRTLPGGRAPTVPPGPTLRVVGGPSAGAVFPVPADGATVGRAGGGADIQLDDHAVSSLHLRIWPDPAVGIAVRDEGSTNGTALDGRPLPAGQQVAVRPGSAIAIGSSTLVVEATGGSVAAATYREGALHLNRPARVVPTSPDLVVRLPAPPEPPKGRGLPLASALGPLAVGVGGAAVLGRPEMLAFAALSPVMAVTSVVSERRTGRASHKKAEAAFNASLAAALREAEEAHDASSRARRALAPDLSVLAERAAGPDARLWERDVSDADALVLRVGAANLPTLVRYEDEAEAGRRLQAGPAAPPPGAAKVEELRHAYALEPDVPVVVPLVEDGVLGIAGTPAKADALARAVIAQVVTLHTPAQVELTALVAPDRADGWSWVLWLPHTEVPEGADVGERAVATTGPAAQVLLQRLADTVRARQDAAGRGQQGWSGPRTVLLVAGEVDVPRPTLAAVLRDGPAVGVHAVVVAETAEELPGACGAVVEVGFDSASLLRVRQAETTAPVVADGLGTSAALDLALRLAPIRDAAAVRRGGDLPAATNLLDLAGLQPPSPAAVSARWDRSHGGLSAPLGVSTVGVLEVDLRADGPHALVAGTTGAGKSELLQTWVASLAAHHPPERLTFVLVDYKGGAAFGVCESLPHVVGFVTDLDGRLALRALESLNAELRRREHIITVEHRCGDLKALEEKRPDVVLPSLFLVFDEFAFLRKEVPEFVDGIIDIAQRGRSLGVHLALATQRPAGVVDDKIKANVDLRIALRVADPQDSSDVIDSKDAARIPKGRPGRGYVRRGAGTLPQPFQAAYVGARRPEGATRAPVRLRPLSFEDAPTPQPAAPRAAPAGERHPSDLERLVRAVGEAWTSRGAPAPVRPWTEPLPSVLELSTLGEPPRPAALVGRLAAPLGLADLPSEQAQRPWWADLDGNLAIYGAGGSGRSTLVRTLVAGLVAQLGPDALWVYGIDAGSRGLDPLASLPHCGGVAPIGDLERTERVITIVEDIVAERRAAAATGPWGGPGRPFVLLVVEGYGGFVDAVRDVDHGAMADRLERVVADGRSVGVHVVLTADRRGSVPTAVAGVVANQVVLRLASDDEYAWLGLGRAAAGASSFPPGRCFVDGMTELQVAVAGGPTVLEQAGSLTALAARWPSQPSAVSVQILGEVVPRSSLPPAASPLRLPLGIDGGTLQPAEVALDLVPSFLVCGPDGTGRSTALATLALAAAAADPSLEAYLLAPRKTPLLELGCWKEVARGVDACQQLAMLLAVEVQDRVSEEGRPFLVVVDDGEQLMDGLVATHLETVVKKGRDLPALVLASVQTHAVRRAFSGWLPEVRNAKHGLLLLPDLTTDGDILGVQLPRKQVRSWPSGRGYLVRRGQVQLVQVGS